jgi:hypothetical protein
MDYKLKYLKYKNKYLVLKKQHGGYLTEEEKILLKNAGFEQTVIDSLEMQQTDPVYIAGIIAEARKAIASGEPVYVESVDIETQITIQREHIARLNATLAEIKKSNIRQLEELSKRGLTLTIDQINILFNHGWSIEMIHNFGIQDSSPEVRNKIIQDLSKLPLEIPLNIKEITERIEIATIRLNLLIERK